VKAGNNLKEAVVENLAGNGKDGIIDDYKGKLRDQELGLQAKIDKTLKESLVDIANNPDKAKHQLEKVANKAIKADGVKGDVEIEFYNKKDGTMGGHKDGKVYINLAEQDGSAATMMEVVGDELSHYVDYKKGRPNSNVDKSRQPVSTGYGNDAREQTIGYVGDEGVDKTAFQESLKGLDFADENKEVDGVEGMENRTTVYARKLKLPGKLEDLGVHLFGKVTDRKDGKPDFHFSLDGKAMGGAPEINTKQVIKNDMDAFKNGKIVDSQVIEVPAGMTESEFDEKVINNVKAYQTNTYDNYYPVAGVGVGINERNSNTMVDNIVEESGGKIKDFKKAVNQNAGEKIEKDIDKYHNDIYEIDKNFYKYNPKYNEKKKKEYFENEKRIRLREFRGFGN
jgi:hypothetical protein